MELQKINHQQGLTITSKNWLEKWAAVPAKVNTTSAELLILNTPQLCQLGRNTDGEMMGVTVFQVQLTLMIEFMGLNWNPDQINECGQLAYDESYWLSIAELKQFLIRVKTGYYKSNKNIAPAVFLEFLQDYTSEILSCREQYYGSKPAKRKYLSIEPLKGKSRKVALWLVELAKESHERTGDQAIEQMRQLTATLCSEQRQQEAQEREELREKYQTLLKDKLAQNNEQVKALMAQGLTVDEAIEELSRT